MNVHELVAEVEQRVPEDAPAGTRFQASGVVTTDHGAHLVVVAARIDMKGRRREQYFCDGTRLQRYVLLRLICAETECPQARMVREQWNEFHWRRGEARPRRASDSPQSEVLMREVPIAVAGQRCVARPARFNCFSACPNRAHPPMRIQKTGYDLFEDGACLGGGVTSKEGFCRPRLPSVRAAEAFLFARHLEALAMRDAAANGSGRSCT